MTERIELLTFETKYNEQLVSMRIPGGTMNRRLFDATELFMTNNTFVEKKRVMPQAKEFAERFVAQMNANGVKA